MLDASLFEKVHLLNFVFSLIVDDIGVGFIFPIYTIIYTKRYMLKLWDDT